MDLYDEISKRIDIINDIILGSISDKEMGGVLTAEAEILQAVARTEGRA